MSLSVGYLELCVILVYSEPCHIQNPGIFRTWDIFRTPSGHILAYSEHFEHYSHVENPVIFRTLPYSGFWHIPDQRYIQNSVEHLRWRRLLKGKLFFCKSILAVWSDKVLNTPLTQEVLSTLYSNLRLCTISGILRTLAYSKLCLFRHVQAYSIIFIITLNFPFFTYILFSEI